MTRFITQYTSVILLAGLFSGCRPAPEAEPVVPMNAGRQAASSFLFEGNPGVATGMRDDLTGTATGTIGGQPVKVGPGKDTLLIANTFYAGGSDPNKPGVFNVGAGGLQLSVSTVGYMLNFFLRGPVRVGSYEFASASRSTDQSLTVSAILYIVDRKNTVPDPNTGLLTPKQKPVANKQFRITAISPAWIELEYTFALRDPNAPDERVAIRMRNFLNENANVTAVNPIGAPWNYKATRRDVMIDPAGYYKPGFGSKLTANEVVVKMVQTLDTPVSSATYAGKTARFDSQTSILKRLTTPANAAEVRLTGSTNYTPAGEATSFGLVFTNFSGVGTYTNAQVGLSYMVSAGQRGWWQINTAQQTTASTRTQVVVSRVTPDIIQGTYTVQNAPLQYGSGSGQPTGPVSLSGTFSAIYPR